jgi:hypothetical protein
VIAVRRPQHIIGWLFCVIGVLYPLETVLYKYALHGLMRVPGSLPGAIWAGVAQVPVGVSPWMLLIYSLMVFPTGRHLSRSWQMAARMVVAIYILIILLEMFTSPKLSPLPVANPLRLTVSGTLGDFLPLVTSFAGVTFVVILADALVTRFRRARGVEGKQLQWLAYAATLWLANTLAAALLPLVFDPKLVQVFTAPIFALAIAGFAIATAVAILKYRLYDIDIIIRRTLIYSLLTALLAAIYLGGVALLQSLLRPLTGAGNDLAVVTTTLVIAALFLPLRRRVHGFIDRHFYRRKYDAAKILAAFGEHARDEVELDKLTGRLGEVVEDTMQPDQVSLWLAQPAADTDVSLKESA